MSRSFDGTNSNHLDASSADFTAPTFSMCAWIKLASLGSARQVLNVGTAASGDNRFALHTNATNFPVHTARDTTSVSATCGMDINETTSWHLIACSSANTSSRSVYLDGTNKATNGALKVPGVPGVMRISGSPDGLNNMNGLVGHVAIWSDVLSDSDMALLMTMKPYAVRPDILLDYWPMTNNVSPEPSFGSLRTAMTLTGAPFSSDDPYTTTLQLMGACCT